MTDDALIKTMIRMTMENLLCCIRLDRNAHRTRAHLQRERDLVEGRDADAAGEVPLPAQLRRPTPRSVSGLSRRGFSEVSLRFL
jgi:hypothetical protein